MRDRLSRAERSQHMARIRGKNTKPELHVRRGLHRMGIRFRLHRHGLAGRPDIVLPRYRTVIFVHGCFWHRHARCKLAYRPKSRRAFWHAKFKANVARDRRQTAELLKAGWRVIVVWECGLRQASKLQPTLRVIARKIRATKDAYTEVPSLKSTPES